MEVAELLPQIIGWNREFLQSVNGRLMEEPRVSIKLQDVYDLMAGGAGMRYHAILLDVDNSPDPLVQKGNARLYARPGLVRIREALHPGAGCLLVGQPRRSLCQIPARHLPQGGVHLCEILSKSQTFQPHPVCGGPGLSPKG